MPSRPIPIGIVRRSVLASRRAGRRSAAFGWSSGRTSPAFSAGAGSFHCSTRGLIEIGYRYVQAAWGQGIASEAAAAVLAHGFCALALDPIVGVTHPDNRASQRVLEKIGLRPAGEAYHYGQWLRSFRLTRVQYLML